MKALLLLVFVIAAASITLGQQPTPSPSPGTDSTRGVEVNNGEEPKKQSEAKTTSPADTAPPQNGNGYVRPDAKTRRRHFINRVVGPWALGRIAFNAGLSTWRDSPEEWGQTWEGYGRRVASNFGRNTIGQTTTYALDEAFKLDSHFYRSKNRSVGARIKNSLLSPVTARDKNGKRVVGVPRLVGIYTGNIIARETWYPDRYDWKDGVKSGTMSLGFNAVFNLFKEFVWKK